MLDPDDDDNDEDQVAAGAAFLHQIRVSTRERLRRERTEQVAETLEASASQFSKYSTDNYF